MRVTPEQAACEVLEVVPLVMRDIRAEMRRHRSCDLSVPQFRTLSFLDQHSGASLSDVAENIGLALPSMSKLVDSLVARKLVTREMHAGDRRRVTLALTARGRASLESARASTAAYLAGRVATLPEADRMVVVQAMQALRPLFGGEREMLTYAGRDCTR